MGMPLDLLDVKFCPDGQSFATTDVYGHVSVYGFGDTEKFRGLPVAQFFSYDFSELARDPQQYVRRPLINEELTALMQRSYACAAS